MGSSIRNFCYLSCGIGIYMAFGIVIVKSAVYECFIALEGAVWVVAFKVILRAWSTAIIKVSEKGYPHININ